MSFDRPYLLLLLVAVPAAAVTYRLVRARPSRHAVRYTNLDVLVEVVPGERSWRRALAGCLLLGSLAAAGVAVAGPHVTTSTTSERATVVLVVDTSRSMQSQDVRPSRLAAAKSAALTFLDRVPGRLRVGLVLFSGDVVVAAVPTREHERVRAGVTAIGPYDGYGGTAIGDAVARATEVGLTSLAEGDGGVPERAPPEAAEGLVTILFLSDGRQNRGLLPPLEGAARAQSAGIPVFTVALGRDDGGSPGGGRSFSGRWNRAPDPATLRAIARLTGGEFFEARDDVELTSAYAELGSRLGRERRRSEVSAAFAGAAAAALLAAGLLGAWWTPRLP
jgi:Ca-activated chloride channel family protein